MGDGSGDGGGGLGAGFRALGADDPASVAGYRLAARLGAGGMGSVYLSYTPGGRPVAIKVIRPEFAGDPEFRRRFRQEVGAAQRVQGLYTASVVDFDTEGPRPWLATTYVAGPSLADAVSGQGPLPAGTVPLLVAGVAEALTAIHGADVLHRDLKPSNVLLASDGPRVIDFGIARAADATALTGTGSVIGTPAFMSPEQATGGALTPASDVFALGQIAVYAATGRPAYGDGPSHALLYRIVHEEPDLSDVPAALRPLAELCLAKAPEERGTPADVIAACERATPEGRLRLGDSWLPGALTAAITARTPAAPPAPAYAPHPPTRPAGPHAAPTQTAYATPYGGPTTRPAASVPGGRRRARTAVAAAAAALVLFGGGVLAATLFDQGDQGSQGNQGNDKSGGSGGTSGQARGGTTPTATTPTATTPTGVTPTKESSAPAQQEAPPKAEQYKALDLPVDHGLNLSDNPPRPVDGTGQYSGDFDYAGWNLDAFRAAPENQLALFAEGKRGSLETCRSAARYITKIKVADLSAGDQFCVRTKDGDLGLVTFRSDSPENTEGTASQFATIDLTVWHDALSQ
ncbi:MULTISPECIES: serine/threonine-protein kinase [unclassified Streptomyces]|uniref:serine/threonine-protein kinase n=1 Tax=unclassified Streptomyces TaxID=2593676 RepID=UPI00278BE080|nr:MULTISPECIES: serine/threonine-protein kinase [unclassified Streptomyces]